MGEWPNLSDPIPDASERNRVVERSRPAAPIAVEAPANDSAMTGADATQLVTSVTQQVEKARKLYVSAKKEIETKAGEEKLIAWHEAQLLLTRLSYSIEPLDSVLLAEKLKGQAAWKSANLLKKKVDIFVSGERQSLILLKP